MPSGEKTFDIEELAALAGLPRRTVRYYIQEGLVDRPSGSRKGATYGGRHLEQLLSIRRWKDSGLTLERIRQLLEEQASPSPGVERPRGPGTVEVVTRVVVAHGVEILLEPHTSGMTPEQVRSFIAAVAETHSRILSKGST